MTRHRRPVRIPVLAAALLACAAVVPTAPPARAAIADNADFTMEILVDGRPLSEYAARGAVYVEALEGREYSVRLRNRTAGRVAVALSVDGLNSIDAATTSAREARKWILGPYEMITLDGWQTGQATARRFFFTSEGRSYGAWLDQTDNLGIVSAAFFREQLPPPVTRRRSWRRGDRGGAREGEPSPVAPDAAAPRAESGKSSADDDYAATGIGREVDHRVREVRFEAEPHPAAVIDLRYEYHDALVRLGVLPPRDCDEPLARRERARGFDDSGFAPDPYRAR